MSITTLELDPESDYPIPEEFVDAFVMTAASEVYRHCEELQHEFYEVVDSETRDRFRRSLVPLRRWLDILDQVDDADGRRIILDGETLAILLPWTIDRAKYRVSELAKEGSSASEILRWAAIGVGLLALAQGGETS